MNTILMPTVVEESGPRSWLYRHVLGVTPRALCLRLLVLDAVFAVSSILLGLYFTGNPARYFGEGRPVTWWSCIQLLSVGYICWNTFKLRRPEVLRVSSASLIWGFLAVGFVFLAIDEVARVHEKLDLLIHWLFQIQHTSFTDHLDEAILLSYALVGGAVMWAWRSELLSYLPNLRFMALGISLFAMMLLGDFINNGNPLGLAQGPLNNIEAVEDSIKIFGESFFVAAFATCFWNAKGRSTNRVTSNQKADL